MEAKQNIEALIHERLRDPATSWSIGTFGAIGEFHRDADEPTEISLSPGGGTVLTDRGGIRVEISDRVRVAPYESLRRGRDLWQHGVNVCQDAGVAGRAKHAALTEIGRITMLFVPKIGMRSCSIWGWRHHTLMSVFAQTIPN